MFLLHSVHKVKVYSMYMGISNENKTRLIVHCFVRNYVYTCIKITSLHINLFAELNLTHS